MLGRSWDKIQEELKEKSKEKLKLVKTIFIAPASPVNAAQLIASPSRSFTPPMPIPISSSPHARSYNKSKSVLEVLEVGRPYSPTHDYLQEFQEQGAEQDFKRDSGFDLDTDTDIDTDRDFDKGADNLVDIFNDLHFTFDEHDQDHINRLRSPDGLDEFDLYGINSPAAPPVLTSALKPVFKPVAKPVLSPLAAPPPSPMPPLFL